MYFINGVDQVFYFKFIVLEVVYKVIKYLFLDFLVALEVEQGLQAVLKFNVELVKAVLEIGD